MLTRWLHRDDPSRKLGEDGKDNGSGFVSAEHRGPPDARTHEESRAQGIAAENFIGSKDSIHHPKKQSGIAGWCPLGELPFFDIIWDVCPDMMHILKNLFERFSAACSMETASRRTQHISGPGKTSRTTKPSSKNTRETTPDMQKQQNEPRGAPSVHMGSSKSKLGARNCLLTKERASRVHWCLSRRCRDTASRRPRRG